jgi:hypothetical protein
LKYRFYSVNSDYKNYEALLKYGCRNIFETVESWRMASIHFDAKVKLNLCDKKNLKLFLSSSELKQEACHLVLSYFCLVSKSMRECQKKSIAEQITAFNIPSLIERLQNLFIESVAIRYYVVRNLLRSCGRFIAGMDMVSFLSFKLECFRFQKKSFKNTTLTKEIRRCIKRQVDHQNLRLCIKLFQSCNPKTYRKNYKGDTVKKIWSSYLYSMEKQPQHILTLKDRLLQMIINAAVHPILEYQADPNSFAYRPNRFTIDAIALVVKHLEHFQKQKRSFTYLQLKVSKSICNIVQDKKIKEK